MNEPITDKMEAIAPPILFPGKGKTYECLYPEWSIRLHFISEVQALVMSKTTDDAEVVDISILQIRPGLFLIHWQEQDGTVVSSIQDYDREAVITCATHHKATLCKQGRFREVQP